ncbi:MAG: ketoacyl-ACP synthase III [Gammaproteobacteria bacterium]|nr:ketoacyl-ACP synthase III [Gammaproteobacteria bacterium]
MNHRVSFNLQRRLEKRAKILSVGTYLPTQIVKSDDLFEEIKSEQNYGIPTDFMSKGMGIIERRMSEDTALPSALAIPAARKALENCPGLNPDKIGLVIFTGIERDQPEPATAHTVQNALGLKADNVFDVANACLGFVDGVKIASKYITSGVVEYALVATGEVSTRVLRSFVSQLKAGVDIETANKLIGGLSVGDAGGAVIMGLSKDSGFQAFNNDADSSHIDKCIYRVREDGSIDGQMLMARILAQGIKMHRNAINNTLDELGWDKFDWVLSHQTGRRNFEAFSKMPGISEDRMIKTYERLGNTTTATLPLGWEILSKNGKVKPGDKIGGLFAGSGLATCQFGMYY